MTPLQRLLQEAIPTRPAPAPNTPRPVEPGRYWTPEEQDAHWADLAAALGIPNEPRPHLRSLPAA